MRGSTSRDSLATAKTIFSELTSAADEDALNRLGEELSMVTEVLNSELSLRKHLSEPSSTGQARTRLADAVFGGKIGETSMRMLGALVDQRWSRSADLLDGVQYFARQAVLSSAEHAGRVDEVEDELFRFSRMLQSETRLRSLLDDTARSAEARIGLLDDVLADRASPQTAALLRAAVRTAPRVGLDVEVAEMAELAAARRDESVARVTAAAPLTEEQQQRLSEVLQRIYGRTVSLQVDIDPEVLGGLIVRVGDEVIDGSIASRLARASQELPD